MSEQAPVAPRPATVLAHDYLLVLRGAERAFAQMADMLPRRTGADAALRPRGDR